ncbi:MAG TPA: heme exporter protein CcmB [Thermomicrobiaceae bacterium]|nr:heme exporter protein CcmB [Thermomicrobiaceae bacterium]
MNALAKVSAVAWKDLLTEVRTKELFGGMFVFAVLTIITFNFAFDLTGVNRAASGAGALWVAFTFAGMLGLSRSIALERDRGSLDGLLLCPVDRGILYLGKLAGNLLFILVVEVIAVPIFGALYNLPVYRPLLLAALLLGTLGFASIGTLFAVMASGTQAREVLFPVLLFPLSVPLVIGTVKAAELALTGQTGEAVPWLNLLVAFDLIFLSLAFVLFERVVEE